MCQEDSTISEVAKSGYKYRRKLKSKEGFVFSVLMSSVRVALFVCVEVWRFILTFTLCCYATLRDRILNADAQSEAGESGRISALASLRSEDGYRMCQTERLRRKGC